MLREIRIITKLNLCNIYGLNVFKNNKDKKAKKIYIALATVILLVAIMMAAYVGMFVYGYVMIGLGEIVPAYLVMISSMIILLFGIFKAGPVIFERKGYDIICSLPVSPRAIVIARFVRMYVENMTFLLVVMVPGVLVYGFLLKPTIGFYIAAIVITVLLPFAPMTIAIVIGSIITAVSSRMKHKSIFAALLPIVVVVGTLAITGSLSMNVGQITPEMLYDFSEVITGLIANIYPPAVWFGNMMLGAGLMKAIVFAVFTFAILGMTVFVIGNNFHSICQSLYGTTAKHEFTMGQQEQTNVIVALCKKEFKRYFASSVYFANTIMGPVLAVVMAASLLFIDLETAFEVFPMEIDVVGILPLVIGTTFCMMNTTSTSISMEGKEWWILKTLPLTSKQILDCKLLMNLVLFAPFYVISVVLMIIAIKPMGLDLLWTIVSPAVLILFSCVWGLFINLKFPVFNWENETQVVKQGMSSIVGGLCSALVGVVMIFLLVVIPASLSWVLKASFLVVLVVIVAVLYNKNNKVKLEEL